MNRVGLSHIIDLVKSEVIIHIPQCCSYIVFKNCFHFRRGIFFLESSDIFVDRSSPFYARSRFCFWNKSQDVNHIGVGGITSNDVA